MNPLSFRDTPRESDVDLVRRLARDSGGFSESEVGIAVELIEERLARGAEASGYHFLFAEAEAGTVPGYACHGPIALTRSSWDLYWIAVVKNAQGRGIARRLLAEAERQASKLGATQMYVDTSGRPDYLRSQSFYEAAGYTLLATLPDFYAPGDAKLIFAKHLTRAWTY